MNEEVKTIVMWFKSCNLRALCDGLFLMQPFFCLLYVFAFLATVVVLDDKILFTLPVGCRHEYVLMMVMFYIEGAQNGLLTIKVFMNNYESVIENPVNSTVVIHANTYLASVRVQWTSRRR